MVLEVQESNKRKNEIDKKIREVSNFKIKLDISSLMIRLDKIEETLNQHFSFMSNVQVERMLRALAKTSYQITKKINIKLKTVKLQNKKDYLHFIYRRTINKKNKLVRNYKIKTQ